jgi:dCMP deaminase
MIGWDTYFINIAHAVKLRSKDPKLKVGSVLVSLKDNRIISTGYNSMVAGIDDSLIDWSDRTKVKELVIHAEMNAVLYAQSKFEDSVLYCSHSPCGSCLKLISATKIKKIVYDNVYKDICKTEELCKFFNIEIYQLNQESY